ncbi:uncharacterized protein LOC131948026 [Physella acuta]|uniref:uncharacterized protein LOC131948026 n=1 Tax=Physella acuta TaxID=109671 RepID=UPI0027DB0874|nr:uncharacterized protein LOC131948026 [Physella acuta]XP_059165468.1 uncharacterized protein LOC131948026 [Physella acuta]XP_059165469.1 uncharacterized protein LOC131948026 [Physella acuta]XP_059165470.1 uncharacterized protein LOC131948026 [Physella acuta]XP_059165471.1 uncharacterized protein LOC131948026 [Physella acuta]XP_059165473.1 uncharacterized protein LOC131948026 [Physella acuta]
MSTDGLGRVEISHPILQSATNNQVNPFFKEGTVYHPSKEILVRQRQEYATKKTPSTQDEALKQLDNKYASPANILTGMNSQLNLAQIEADALRSSAGGSVLSDTSSDISDVIPKTNTGNSTFVLPLVEGLNDEDIIQVEMFYRSHKSEIRVCRSLANLYVSVPKLHERPKVIQLMEKTCRAPPPAEKALDPLDFSKDDWEFSKTGVPVLVLDTGQHVRERRLTILLAEKGTGFTLWQDQVNHLTRYSTPHTNFHTITISTDSTRLVGLSFDDGNAAADFADAVRKLISNSDDDMLKLGKKKKKKKEKDKQKAKPPKKVDISQPCCFVHVTKLERPNFGANLYPLAPSESQADTWGRAMSQNSGISESTSSLDQ